MPNHTSCVLKVVGNIGAINKFIAVAAHTSKDDNGKEQSDIFSFKSLLPMPPELVGTPSPCRVVSEEEYEKAIKDQEASLARGDEWARLIELPLTAKRQNELRAKFGVDNWYDWAKHNWGTKWDVYDVSEKWEEGAVDAPKVLGFGEQTTAIDTTQSTITCYFQSAWSPPCEGLRQISENFPELKFYCGYADEGGGYIGYSTFEDGSEIETMLPHQPWDGDDQKEFRALCGQFIYEDEEDETAYLPKSTN